MDFENQSVPDNKDSAPFSEVTTADGAAETAANPEDLANAPGENDDAVIKICGLTKKYGTKCAVDGIDFSVKRGEIMGFLGPNGAGKSTTMNILTGYISATSGAVLVDGIDILENPKAVKKKIGYLPENPPLYFDMTVREYLEFVYELKKVKEKRDAHLGRIMQIVKITHVADRMIKNLSKGYKQRVGLAQALIGDPEVLVLDEPTVGLDPKQIIEIRNVIKELGRSRTVILSTHILQEVSAVCDRVTIINHGRIVAMNTLEGLSEDMGEKGKYLIRAAESETKVRFVLSSIPGMKYMGYVNSFEPGTSDFIIEFEPGLDLRENVFRAFAEADIPLIGFKSMELTLEEIFIRVTNAPEVVEEPEEEKRRKNKADRHGKKDKPTGDNAAEEETENTAADKESGKSADSEEKEAEDNESNI